MCRHSLKVHSGWDHTHSSCKLRTITLSLSLTVLVSCLYCKCWLHRTHQFCRQFWKTLGIWDISSLADQILLGMRPGIPGGVDAYALQSSKIHIVQSAWKIVRKTLVCIWDGRDVVLVLTSRSRDVVFKRLGLVSISWNVGRSRSRSRLGLKIICLGLVSVSCQRVSFTSQYAQLFASLHNCTYIVLNARRLYRLLIHKLMSPLHPCCIHLQLQCSTQFKKVFFLDFANAKYLITSSQSTERSMSASMQSRDRESNLSWHIVVLYGFLILLSIVCKHWW